MVDLDKLAAELFERAEQGEAQVVPRVDFRGRIRDWDPQPKRCHDNVEFWVSSIPGYRACPRYLFFDLLGRFVAHTVLELPDGRLIDITPAMKLDAAVYPFLKHQGESALFDAVERHGHIDLIRAGLDGPF